MNLFKHYIYTGLEVLWIFICLWIILLFFYDYITWSKRFQYVFDDIFKWKIVENLY